MDGIARSTDVLGAVCEKSEKGSSIMDGLLQNLESVPLTSWTCKAFESWLALMKQFPDDHSLPLPTCICLDLKKHQTAVSK